MSHTDLLQQGHSITVLNLNFSELFTTLSSFTSVCAGKLHLVFDTVVAMGQKTPEFKDEVLEPNNFVCVVHGWSFSKV